MKDLLKRLNKEMIDKFISVNKERNPFYVNLRALGANQLKSSLVQY